jgi:hypothetical protein
MLPLRFTTFVLGSRLMSPRALTKMRFFRCQSILLTFATALVCGLHFAAGAEVPPPAEQASEDWFRPEDEPQSLKRVLAEGHVTDRWIYHDLDAARLQARKTGKPILVVFCCVPCGAAPELDGALCTAGGADAAKFEAQIRAAGGDLGALLDQFVAVRMVKMNGVNRHVFSFDRDVPHVATFLNADGVVYGRYGTRVSRDRKNLLRHNLPSFQQSLRRALELHNSPRKPAESAAKRKAKSSPAFAEDMATFQPFPAKSNPHVENCIHCHTVGEAEKRQILAEGQLALRDVWPFPWPQNIGLKIAIDDGLKVESVSDASPAREAGIQKGDVLLRLADQPLTSEADIQWVLHHAPDQAALSVIVRRGEQTVESAIVLQGDWRKSDGHWRASLGPLRPNFELRPEPYKVKLGAKPGQMGLAITYPRGPALTSGLRNGDLLIAVDGRTDMHLEADFLKYIHIDKPEAKSVQATIIRQGTTSTLTLPIR